MVLSAINHADRSVPTGFSYAIEAGGAARMLFISGQVGRLPDGTVPAGIVAQTQVTIAKLNALLEAAGMTFANVAKLTIFLTNEADYPGFWSVYQPAMPSPPPAATGVIVKALVDAAYLVEIEAIAIA